MCRNHHCCFFRALGRKGAHLPFRASKLTQVTSYFNCCCLIIVLEKYAILLDMTNTVDYDQEAYAQLLEEMVREKQEVLSDLALKARAFR